jgi:hypothetical protein
MTRHCPLPLALRALPLTRSLPLAVLTLLFALCPLPFAAHGQSATATLSGTVMDQNNAVVPGAAITVTNTATGLKRETSTNDEGYFTIPLLPPSTYVLRAEHAGFTPLQIPNVVLNVGDQKSLTIALKAGNISAMVQITADAPLVDTSPAVGTVVDRQFVENIPLNGRSFQSLITLTPGVVLAPSTATTNSAGQFSVNGQRASANSFTVDGVSANFGASPNDFGEAQTSGNLPGLTTLGTTQSLVSIDALQEFKVQTSTYAAEYGRQAGGQISIVTRSGTNQFHGSAFEYVRNDIFDANDWFANRAGTPKAKERQNDFGGTFSGPVLLPRFGEGGHQPGYDGRNRTFFFFSYEGLRLRQPNFNLTNVPTLALRQQAPAGMQPILNAFPLPNGKDLGNGLAEFAASYSDPSSLNATGIRIDHTVNSKLTVFARYNNAPSESLTRRAGSTLSSLLSSRLAAQTITAGATASLTPQASNELRLNYSDNGAFARSTLDNFGGATPPPRNVLIPTQYDSTFAQGQVRLQSFPGLTSTAFPFLLITDNGVSSQHQFNIADNFSYSAGSHQFKFGVDYRRLTPVVSFNSYILSSTFSSQAQVLAATASTGSLQANVPLRPVVLNFSAYGQDTWKLSRRLTLDLGVRWDVNPAPSEATRHPPVAVTQIDNLSTMQLAPLGTKRWKTTYNNFAPRLGVAYRLFPTAGRETVVRGGFGLFYDTGNDRGAAFVNGFPYSSLRTLSNIVYPLSATQVAPAPFPFQNGLTPPYQNFYVFDPALKLPYTWQWNLAVEQSLGRSQAVTLSYVGAAGRRLPQSTQLSLNAINPSFTLVRFIRNNASSDYDALQAQFQRRLSRGLQTLVSYTWSHTLDDDSDSLTLRAAQRGNAAFDVRHVFAAAATYDIPTLGTNSLTRAVLGRWSIDTNIHVQSALPVDLVATTLTNPADGSLISVRPKIIAGVPLYLYGSQYPGGRIINNTVPAAAQVAAAGCNPTGAAKGPFCTPLAGQSGNFGRNQVRGLGAWQVDAALRRQFKLTERVNMQFRAEAFNVFNHPNFGTIQTSLSAANFGQATNMLGRQLGGLNALYQIGGPRSFQFALKLIF